VFCRDLYLYIAVWSHHLDIHMMFAKLGVHFHKRCFFQWCSIYLPDCQLQYLLREMKLWVMENNCVEGGIKWK